MRGKRAPCHFEDFPVGITPAYAGKTEADVPAMVNCLGSPPRMRGKQLGCDECHCGSGITPAHAGKTSMCRNMLPGIRDHPRACGENLNLESSKNIGMGSPPRMRGKPTFHSDGTVRIGITPAHAGKTAKRAGELMLAKDHPRACGENTVPKIGTPSRMGSPPRMRGKLNGEPWFIAADGITPAHAGKTRTRRRL